MASLLFGVEHAREGSVAGPVMRRSGRPLLRLVAQEEREHVCGAYVRVVEVMRSEARRLQPGSEGRLLLEEGAECLLQYLSARRRANG